MLKMVNVINRAGHLYHREQQLGSRRTTDPFSRVMDVPLFNWNYNADHPFQLTVDGELYDVNKKSLVRYGANNPVRFKQLICLEGHLILLRNNGKLLVSSQFSIRNGNSIRSSSNKIDKDVEYIGVTLSNSCYYVKGQNLYVYDYVGMGHLYRPNSNPFNIESPILAIHNNTLVTEAGLVNIYNQDDIFTIPLLGDYNNQDLYYRFIGCGLIEYKSTKQGNKNYRLIIFEIVEGHFSARIVLNSVRGKWIGKPLDNVVGNALHHSSPWVDVVNIENTVKLINGSGMVMSINLEGGITNMREYSDIFKTVTMSKGARNVAKRS
jgi:hypothetical protein